MSISETFNFSNSSHGGGLITIKKALSLGSESLNLVLFWEMLQTPVKAVPNPISQIIEYFGIFCLSFHKELLISVVSPFMILFLC